MEQLKQPTITFLFSSCFVVGIYGWDRIQCVMWECDNVLLTYPMHMTAIYKNTHHAVDDLTLGLLFVGFPFFSISHTRKTRTRPDESEKSCNKNTKPRAVLTNPPCFLGALKSESNHTLYSNWWRNTFKMRTWRCYMFYQTTVLLIYINLRFLCLVRVQQLWTVKTKHLTELGEQLKIDSNRRPNVNQAHQHYSFAHYFHYKHLTQHTANWNIANERCWIIANMLSVKVLNYINI